MRKPDPVGYTWGHRTARHRPEQGARCLSPEGRAPMAELTQYLIGGLVVGSIYGLIGIGYTGVYNVTRIVNFAQGDFAMVGAMTAIAVFELGAPLPLAVGAAIVSVGALGAAVERWAIRPARADE